VYLTQQRRFTSNFQKNKQTNALRADYMEKTNF